MKIFLFCISTICLTLWITMVFATEKNPPSKEKQQPIVEKDKDKPAAQKDKPAAEKDKPAAQKDKPAAEKDKPSAEKDKPAAEKSKPTVNIIFKNYKGFGLERDATILTKELKRLGYSVRSYEKSSPSVREADINIFLEKVNFNLFSFAKKNYFIPNPEWFLEDVATIPKFDMILCKTREGERIYKEYHPNTVYIGFTSLDRYKPEVYKNYREALHLAGRSPVKGTDSLVKSWELNPDLPELIIYRHLGKCDYPTLNNMHMFCGFLEDDNQFKEIQNAYGLHLCPSETEGFGQYIMEALSCGAIVVTTDAPPMNEFVKDKRCLAAYTHSSNILGLSTSYFVDPVHLGKVVSDLMLLSDQELADIGRKNRLFYLKNKRLFKEKIWKIFTLGQKEIPLSKTGNLQ